MATRTRHTQRSRGKKRRNTGSAEYAEDRPLTRSNQSLTPQLLAKAPAQALPPGQILSLQQSVGNGAVQRSLAKRKKRAGQSNPGQANVNPTQGMMMAQALAGSPHGQTDAPPLAVQQRTGGPEMIQRGRGARFAKAQLMGMNKTVNPFFGWKGYYKSVDDIVNGEEASAKYGNVGFRVMNYLVETADRIASVFTAFAFIFTGLGAVLAPFFGAGAVLLSAATIFGIIATIAHAVTFLLRSIVTVYDLIRLKKATPGSREHALLKAKVYQDIGGLISNGIGIIMGGLAGGFIGGANVIGGALEGSIGAAAGAPTGALIGEAGNRLADTATGISGTTAHGIEKHAPPRARQNQQRPPPPQQAPLPPRQQGGNGAMVSVDEISSELDEMSSSSSRHSALLSSQVSEQLGAKDGFSQASLKTGELLGKNEELLQQVTKSEEESEKAFEHAKQGVKKNKTPKRKQVDDLEAKVEEAEKEAEKEDLGKEGAKAKPIEIEKIPAQKPQTAIVEELPKPQQAAKLVPGAKPQKAIIEDLSSNRQTTEEEEKVSLKRDPNAGRKRSGAPALQRRGGKVKAFFVKLLARLTGIRKRLKKVSQKIKKKLQTVMISVLGLKKELTGVQAEQQEASAELPDAIKNNQQTQSQSEQVQQQISQAKRVLAQMKQG